MNDQTARSLFIDYLYEEISEEDKIKLEAYLEKNPKLKQELDELSQTRSLLQKMPDEEPSRKFLMMEPKKRSFSQWYQDAKKLLPQSTFGKAGFAIAASVILFLFIGSVTRLHIETAGAGMSVSLGYNPSVTVQKGIPADQVEAIVHQIKQENAVMIAEYAKALEQQNDQQLQQVIAYFEQQRLEDLKLVNRALDEYQQNTNYRLLKTNRYLGEVLQTVSKQN
ncbi:MAG TPA: hypothetical protein VF181_04600 [Balneolaceae bacterium]